MKIILLSGGSGSRLWPLSNDARSKQFLRLLPDPDGHPESMIQRVCRQIRLAGIDADITVATSEAQRDSVFSQLGNDVHIVTEPDRRKTFPAICLAAKHLQIIDKCPPDETILIMPCDTFTDLAYFSVIKQMADAYKKSEYELILMGIAPTYPSTKYGYAIAAGESDGLIKVKKFIEKPDLPHAERLIEDGALWNGGVFATSLNFLTTKSDSYFKTSDFETLRANYTSLPAISFDCEVLEKCNSLAMIRYNEPWMDLGTWNTLTDILKKRTYGNVTTDDSDSDTHIFNELDIPLLCIGTNGLVIAASPDGILVSEKSKSESVKSFAHKLARRPMYEERRWGVYRVIDHTEEADGHCSLTKRLTLRPGASISYQRHAHRDEVWTFIDGEGEIVIDGKRSKVGRDSVVAIKKGQMHALRAISELSLIEVQSGSPLVEEDIERFPYDW